MKVFGSGKRRSPPVQIVDVRPTPAQAVCSECGKAYPVHPPLSQAEWVCPRCGPSVHLDTASWRHRTHPTSRRRIWGQPLPLFAVLLVVSLLPLLTFLLLQLAQLRRPDEDRSLTSPNRPAQTADARTSATDGQQATPDPDPLGIGQPDSTDPQTNGPEESEAIAARTDQDSGRLPLSRLLQVPGSPPEDELRLGCRFVRTIDPNPSWRLGLPEGEVQRPKYRIEVVDAAGQAVSQSFVAADSQAERVVPWLMEGDWVEVVGTIVIRLDRPTRPPILGFLIREIRPADEPEAVQPAA